MTCTLTFLVTLTHLHSREAIVGFLAAFLLIPCSLTQPLTISCHFISGPPHLLSLHCAPNDRHNSSFPFFPHDHTISVLTTFLIFLYISFDHPMFFPTFHSRPNFSYLLRKFSSLATFPPSWVRDRNDSPSPFGNLRYSMIFNNSFFCLGMGRNRGKRGNISKTENLLVTARDKTFPHHRLEVES